MKTKNKKWKQNNNNKKTNKQIRVGMYAKNSQVYMHWHWSSSEKSSFSKPIASVFSPPPIIIFSYGVEIFPHHLVQLIGHVGAFIGYIEM